MDENEIKIKAEKMIDRINFQYLNGVIDIAEYENKMKEIKDWSEQQYKNL
jgi:hypothetical protein